jgi:hypothetical protein
MSAALVYSHSISPRLQYVADFLSQYYGQAFKLTSDEGSFASSPITCKINYSYHRIAEGEIWIHPHALLFETAIHPVRTECFAHQAFSQQQYACFFKTEGDWPFDLPAAIFYLLTRYEEYLPHKKDEYGRYAHQNALAFKEHFLHQPLVNIWLEDFRQLLLVKDSKFAVPHTSFSFLPTYDIDMAWSFQHKGLMRSAGASLNYFLRGRWKSLLHRIRVLRRKEKDPYDTYAWMNELHQKFGLKPLYFFLVARKLSQHDKNISIRNAAFQKLVKEAASLYPIGLHPSWRSGDEPLLLAEERAWLEKTSGQSIHSSRHHFIRFRLPDTYRQLIEAGIQHDYSMGYGSINGFRASIATPFFWYDLKKEEATNLLIHPFCFMDANAYYEQKLSAEQAADELQDYYEVVKKVNGQLITIWHNSFLGTENSFEGWRIVYEQFVAQVVAEIGNAS